MAVIGGFRSDLSIRRKTDGNFGNLSAGVLFSKVAYQRKRWYPRVITKEKDDGYQGKLERLRIPMLQDLFIFAGRARSFGG